MTIPRRPPFKHRSKFGTITLRYRQSRGTLTYEQKGGNQSTVDAAGVSLDAYVQALYGLVLQARARKVLMIGCGGGTLGTMLARAGLRVTIAEIDPVSIRLARRYFGLPETVACHVADGLAFMHATRGRYDAVIVDAFIGEAMPAHMDGAVFFQAVLRCLRKDGIALVNVCLERRSDPAADKMAAGFVQAGAPVRLLDSPGGERNAIVLAGGVRGLRRPKLLAPPLSGAAETGKNLKAMHFRRPRKRKPGR